MAPDGVSGSEDGTVNGGLVANGLRIMASLGLDAGRIATRAGILPEEIADPDARVPMERYHAFWAAVVEVPGGQEVGLAYVDAVRLPMLGALGYVMASAPTVGEAFRGMSRYRRLIGDMIAPDIEVREGRFQFQRHFPPDLAHNRPFCESSVAGFIGLCRELTGTRPVPLEIRYPFPRPADAERSVRLLGCAAEYGCDQILLAFAESLADAPTRTCDVALFTVLSRYADQLVARPPATATIADQVRAAIRRTLTRSEPGVASLALDLGLSERTLQRRLADEGVTLSSLVDQVRRELAQNYLHNPGLTVTEVAFMLGYSEASAFHRAFRRWTGRSPGEYQKAELEGGSKPEGCA